MFSQEQWGQLLANFIEEGRELTRQAESALLAMDEGDTDPDLINGLFRAVHTLKGSAGLFSLEEFVAFAHHQENLIMRVRDAEQRLTREQISVLLQGLDVLSGELERLAAGEEPSPLTRIFAEQFQQIQALAPDSLDNHPAMVDESLVNIAREEHVRAAESWHISLRCDPTLFEFGFDPASFIRYLGKLGQVVHLQVIHQHLPAWSEYQAELCYLGLELDLVSEASKEEIEGVFDFIRELSTLRILPPDSRLQDYLQLMMSLPDEQQLLGEILIASGLLTANELAEGLAHQINDPEAGKLGEVLVQDGVVPAVAVEQALIKQQASRDKKHTDSAFIKVSAGKLDELINLVGELVIAAAGGEMLARGRADSELLASVSAINRHVEQIRESALRLRMVEIGETFLRFQRLVRDASQELGKQIVLKIEGAETELDKSVVDRISEPLTHLVRNALDHGLETPQERLTRGKSEHGTLRLNAFHESGSIVIEVQDDGRGLDAERIRQKAIQKGLLSDEAILDESATYQLIFEPGFSTAETVSNLSGRGVGMDVVRRNVEALRGTIELDSQPGKGCCVRIRLPLTLAIIDGFLVNVGHTPLVIPLDMVTECLDAAGINSQQKYSYRELRGHPLPIINLRHHFAIDGPTAKRENIVVVSHGKQQLGLIVDQLLGEQQIVIKPLGQVFTRLRDISGSSILGSGQVALILDIPGMLQHVHEMLAAAQTVQNT